MINLTKLENSIKFTFSQSDHYLFNGEIEVPLNSLALVIDESEMVTFKKASSNDIFISANISEFGMDKATLEQWFVTNAVDSGISEEEVEEAINTALSYYYDMDEVDDLIENFYDGVEYDNVSSRINFKHGTVVKGYLDATPFIVDGMVSNVEILNGYLVITFNVDSGKQPIQISLTEIFNPSNYYTKTETDALLANKQDTLVAGSGITIENNVISAEGGGKAINAGTNISVTTGETADTINCTVPYAGSPKYTITYGYGVTNNSQHSLVIGAYCTTTSNTQNNIVVGFDCHSMEGHNAAFGFGNYSNNRGELSSGYYNISNSGSTNSDKTLFSVGNGTSNSARHNAFEIRQNGDIYLTLDGQDVKLQDQLGGGGSSYTAGDGIDITNDVISVTGKVDTSAFTAHTADTVIHVTSAEKAAWNAKSDFSGDYNDLTNKPTIPTVPTSNTAFTNDAGYITSSALDGYATTGDVQTATADMATKTWVGNQGYLTEHQSLSNYYTKSETSGATEISIALASKADTATTYTKTDVDGLLANKQNTLVSGTNIKTINNESILGEGNIDIQGGGKAVSAGTNISITTGETADTINCTLPISSGTGSNSIVGIGISVPQRASGQSSTVFGYGFASGYESCSFARGRAFGTHSFAAGSDGLIHATASGGTSAAFGSSLAQGEGSFACGRRCSGLTNSSFVCGYGTVTRNDDEAAFGLSNNSVSASTFGHSGNTLFSVGNGSTYLRNVHNAFEVRQNGDVYIPNTDDSTITGDYAFSEYPMIRLQDTVTQTAANTTALGGLKLVKLTQAEYDALATKDSQTLYIVTDS